MATRKVPFLRPYIGEEEIDEVVATLRSGWLTTGPKVARFEREFADAVRGAHAVAVNSCTAALHLAVEALGLRAGQAVLVPTMTFAATAEIIRYQGAVPILVDCDPTTTNMDLEDAAHKLEALRAGRLRARVPGDAEPVGMIPVHVGGLMMDMSAVRRFAAEHELWVVEDAAHAFPAAWRSSSDAPWQYCGENTSAIACYSFYANKTITVGEGGMAVTGDAGLAERMRLMSLHGLSHDAWSRYSGGNTWDYRIVAPGYKYNLTDIAASLGIHQVAKAEWMRVERETVARRYRDALGEVEEVALPLDDADRIHAWHLFPIRLAPDRLTIGRDAFLEKMKAAGVGCSVHWRPLHLHPYYKNVFGWTASDCPVASSVWTNLVSLPIFPGMSEDEIEHVVDTVKAICAEHARVPAPRIGRAAHGLAEAR
jgi:dTDP-4-amino-4,6-dideoxygalactose transaminase